MSAWLGAPLCLEIGAAESAWRARSPIVAGVWTVRQPHRGNVGALPCDYRLWLKAGKLFLLLGIRKREKSYACLLTPEGSKSLKNVDVDITLGFRG